MIVTADGLLFLGLDGQLYLATFRETPDRLGLFWLVDEVCLSFGRFRMEEGE